MGLFSRRKAAPTDPPSIHAPTSPDVDLAGADDLVEDDGKPQRPGSSPISAVEQERIAEAVARLHSVGSDVDDLESISRALDAALAGEPGSLTGEEAVEIVGLAIGEHLVRHGRMDWRLISDEFGTDLGVVARRGDTSIIPTTVVAARWMRRDTGWIVGYTGRLARLGSS